MPIVPTARQSQFSVIRAPDPPEQKYLAMAAAMMHSQGRLFDPTPLGEQQQFQKSPNERVKEGHEQFDKGQDIMDQSYGTDVLRFNSKTGVRRDPLV